MNSSKNSSLINLFCLPFAGASFYSYGNFHENLADFIHVVPMELPGRGKRISEPILSDLHDMVDDLFNGMKGSLQTPYAFFGHSMGALLGFLLAKRVLKEGLPQPLYLFFSERPAPSTPKKKGVHHLPRREFFEKLREYGGTHEVILNDESVMEFFEPLLRSDLKAVETYVYEKDRPLDLPLLIMCGMNAMITHEEAAKWQEETLKQISVKRFPGEHFFIFDHFPEIGKIISGSLKKFV